MLKDLLRIIHQLSSHDSNNGSWVFWRRKEHWVRVLFQILHGSEKNVSCNNNSQAFYNCNRPIFQFFRHFSVPGLVGLWSQEISTSIISKSNSAFMASTEKVQTINFSPTFPNNANWMFLQSWNWDNFLFFIGFLFTFPFPSLITQFRAVSSQ